MGKGTRLAVVLGFIAGGIGLGVYFGVFHRLLSFLQGIETVPTPEQKINPPRLTISEPDPDEVFKLDSIHIDGTALPNATTNKALTGVTVQVLDNSNNNKVVNQVVQVPETGIFHVPTPDLKPGDYKVTVTVIDVDDQRSQSIVDFTIVGTGGIPGPTPTPIPTPSPTPSPTPTPFPGRINDREMFNLKLLNSRLSKQIGAMKQWTDQQSISYFASTPLAWSGNSPYRINGSTGYSSRELQALEQTAFDRLVELGIPWDWD